MANFQAVATSRDIAKEFNQHHYRVLRTLRNLKEAGLIPEEDVKQSEYRHKQNKQLYPEIKMNNSSYQIVKGHYLTTKPQEQSNVIYILKHKGFEGYYKVGITNNLNSRVAIYKTASPLGIEIIYSKKIRCAPKIEKDIHFSLKNQRRNGEWFRLTSTDVKLIIKKIERMSRNENEE